MKWRNIEGYDNYEVSDQGWTNGRRIKQKGGVLSDQLQQ